MGYLLLTRILETLLTLSYPSISSFLSSFLGFFTFSAVPIGDHPSYYRTPPIVSNVIQPFTLQAEVSSHPDDAGIRQLRDMLGIFYDRIEFIQASVNKSRLLVKGCRRIRASFGSHPRIYLYFHYC
ncbi:hypothetical protein BYT27DRAFT_7196302 [Phlegmacium glaucopus]|nr:hypothetical protein BYT27DRAFT_7196302 [Phlegmacium glaucopus]